VNGAGKPVRLLGVNRSSLEYACVQGWGFSDGAVDAASIAAMKTWAINAVRVPLNEDCWLGINGVKPQYGGAAYRRFVEGYVARLNAAGLTAILDLHWSAPGTQRAAGGKQPLMLGGIAWSNDLSGWVRWRPHDPLHQLIASFHLYNFTTCSTAACWNATVKPVAAVVPVVTGELGENDCASGFVDTYMPWADAAGISYLGWTWDTWNCNSGPALISGYDGTPTPFGAGFRAHLLSLQGR
jgi:hypothetical protein